jgi:hypothetical protein
LMINEYNVPVVVKDAEGTTPMHLAV